MQIVEIRKAIISDLDEVLRLNSELFKKEHQEYDKSLDIKWTQSKLGEEYFAEKIVGSDGFVCVAEDKGKIVGYLCGGLVDRGYRVESTYAELENMFITKKHRRLGIGRKLANAFLAWCDEEHVQYINVGASAKNVDGIEFYKSLGFYLYDVKLQIERQYEIKRN